MNDEPLKSLHAPESLSDAKLSQLRQVATMALIESLRPGGPAALKVRKDGTVLDGHHRLAVLQARGIDVDVLPREVIAREEL